MAIIQILPILKNLRNHNLNYELLPHTIIIIINIDSFSLFKQGKRDFSKENYLVTTFNTTMCSR